MEYKIDIDAMIKERLDKIVDKPCPYELPCGYCTKWDKKCDKKIGCGDDKPQRGLRAESNVYDDNCHIPKGIIRKIIQEVVDYEKAMNELKEITKGATNEYSTE